MKKRIIGIDVARAIAVIGMIIVNFKVVLGGEGADWVKAFASIFDGKAAATFVVLAGVGLALTTKSAIANSDSAKLNIAKKRIAKRALFLFVVGISYIAIWPADILHFYGVYMLVILLLVSSKGIYIVLTGIGFISIYPFLLSIWDYEMNWDFETFTYHNFWTLEGFVSNLFLNGFHPVIPWTAFMLFGYWLRKQDLHNSQFVKTVLWISLTSFIGIQILSYLMISILSEGNQEAISELSLIFGTSPIPPLPIYMFNGIAIAFTVVATCILVGQQFETCKFIGIFSKTGQLALTFYVAHVVIGMGILEILKPNSLGTYPIEFSISYALVFSLLCIFFAIIWLKYKRIGPVEWLMRKLIN